MDNGDKRTESLCGGDEAADEDVGDNGDVGVDEEEENGDDAGEVEESEEA